MNGEPLSHDDQEKLFNSMSNDDKNAILDPYHIFVDVPPVPEESGKKVSTYQKEVYLPRYTSSTVSSELIKSVLSTESL